MLSVGEIIKKQRERLNIDFNEVERAIKVRKKFLLAVEQNNWAIFSSRVYISGIIKNYSLFLGLDPNTTLAFFRRDYERQEAIKFKRRLAGYYFTPETKKAFIVVLVFIFALFFGYFGFQLTLYFSPPKITILSPKTDFFQKKDRVKILAKTEKDATVTILGERVYQNTDGLFEIEFPLKKGKNELVIEVVGANGRKAVFKKIFERNN
ncbi:hypothetical protein A2954_05225 [Candidatus Roizmanbacteria bacterium RIFCSPLOWO2_01_FULL_37_12]|uniref:HTH cro/C1-type domain-containing protein n=1 Tax=Candidatus Roizmanbacteria bacterium RIFCSPLOWO2_01_FULL_37_12 TaxID=1802056 RepID=A0A1F7I8U7_9BACT|nr:MAG: hypothetical protein A2768_02320 [Candidatus Roizmanbacteria bacterium RIFCSPHIGHO2_01_FULL_37_16]OGK24937.1 MAG: hypothetical protein A3D76_02905 [Candidatus Roizmanbacteria bacterium RIFCSPHIGHO2_02_FULL_37_9b]OGK39795.1 MAG: hypothetical protein A2954_05225 [Candidatus Roizmanbacteria bacterium RIFCSPLOWO2_01_FULL_37_12]